MCDQHVNELSAVVAESPAALTGESKNQDRAKWFPDCRTACVCDGVTTSPLSAQAAEMASLCSPAIFLPGLKPRLQLHAIADLLQSRRMEAQRMPVAASPDIPLQMREMVKEAARTTLARACQTTLIAAAFDPQRSKVNVRVAAVGDSAFFAFSNDGELLGSTICDPSACETGTLGKERQNFRFGCGDELLCRVISDAAQHPRLASAAGIRPVSQKNWLICRPVEKQRGSISVTSAVRQTRWLTISQNDILLVPRFLVRRTADSGFRGYGLVHFAASIRVAGRRSILPRSFLGKENATAVLPDSIQTGDWTNLAETYPAGTHFVLCSDGFYSGFAGPNELWSWMSSNGAALHDLDVRNGLLSELHQQLHARQGDDDISFVWVHSRSSCDHCGCSSGLSQGE